VKPLTPAECAGLANVSLSLIYAVLKAGRLKAMRIGCRGKGKWLVDPSDFENWKQSCRLEEMPQEDEGELKWLK
jgi:excisionase family DNA binding protein